MSLPLRKITDIISRRKIAAIYRHLHGANRSTDYILASRDQGQPRFHKARRFEVELAIAWAIDTIEGKADKPIAFVPYCKDKDNFSTHAVMDFDEHDGDGERAKRWAMAAFEALENAVPAMCLMVVRTGKGWHVWAIAGERLPCSYWVELTEKIARDAGMELEPGSCELFPSANFASQQFGRGVRAPGSYTPKYDQVDEVFIRNAEPLVTALLAREVETAAATFPKRERSTLNSTNHLKKDKLREEDKETDQETEDRGNQSEGSTNSTSASVQESDSSISPTADLYDSTSKLYRAWKQRWGRKFKITEQRTRHNQLANLAGEMFHQVGYQMARRIATEQFAKKTVTTKASRDDHLADFEQLWNGLAASWYERLSPEEKARFDSLKSLAQKDAFRIIYSYNRLARQQGATEFFVARDDLASRLGVTPQYAGQMRFAFQESGIIRLTTRYQPHKTANRYSWGLPTLHAQTPTQSMLPTEQACASQSEAPELQIWRMLIAHPCTYNEIWARFYGKISTERLSTAFNRLEGAMCIHRSESATYVASPKPEDSDLRTILEYLAFKTKRDTQIDPTAESLLKEVSVWVPGATLNDLRRAFDIAVKCGILTISGDKTAWLGLGSRLGREEDTKRRKAAIDASKQTLPIATAAAPA